MAQHVYSGVFVCPVTGSTPSCEIIRTKLMASQWIMFPILKKKNWFVWLISHGVVYVNVCYVVIIWLSANSWQKNVADVRQEQATRNSPAVSRLERWRKITRAGLKVLVGKFPAACRKLVMDTLLPLDMMFPCAFHPCFADEFEALRATSQLQIVVASLTPGTINLCAVLSTWASVRARRRGLAEKAKKSSIGCVAPSCLPLPSDRIAVSRLAVLSSGDDGDGAPIFFAGQFSKFQNVRTEYIFCRLLPTSSQLNALGQLVIKISADVFALIQEAFTGPRALFAILLFCLVHTSHICCGPHRLTYNVRPKITWS